MVSNGKDKIGTYDNIIINNDIAVIGMAGKFPMAENLDEFWENIKNGKDCVGDLPYERREDWLPFFGAEALDNLTQFGFLDSINRFDPRFFGIAPGEAPYVDPAQRLLLETVYEALEYGGYCGTKPANLRTGVFIAHGNSGYKQLISKSDYSMAAMMGNLPAVSAGRVSHFFNLSGPSLLIDTACSSSLTALHYAVESIKRNECGMAIVGAVNVHAYFDGKSADMDIDAGDNREDSSHRGLPGRCRVFDKNAGGGVNGEGVGVLLLKPLKQALTDEDIICAVIKGTAVSHNGSGTGTISGQQSESQAEVMLRALESAGVDPTTLSYIEVNGAATKLGDPIEIKSISHVLSGAVDNKELCAVGTVKANIGHLNHASGMAGLIKVILSLREKQIPPLALFKEPNPYINFKNSPVYVNTELKDWTVENNTPRRGGINSFSLNGTNCHVVLEEAPVHRIVSSPSHCNIITISAKSENALKKTCRVFKENLLKNTAPAFNDICFTMNTGRGSCNHRLTLVSETVSRLVEQLNEFESTGYVPGSPDILYNNISGEASGISSKAVFLFSGSKEGLEELAADFKNKGFIAAGYTAECGEYVDLEKNPRARFFAFQYALARMWMDLGVKPAFVLGAGVGKYVSKAVSGNMVLEEALKRVLEDSEESAFNKEKFKDNVKYLASKGHRVFLEIGPKNELGRTLEEMSHVTPGLQVLYSYSTGDYEKTLLLSIALLYTRGVPIHFASLFPGNRVVLPPYQFDRARYWVKSPGIDETTLLNGGLEKWKRLKAMLESDTFDKKAFKKSFDRLTVSLFPGQSDPVPAEVPKKGSPDQVRRKLVQIWRGFFRSAGGRFFCVGWGFVKSDERHFPGSQGIECKNPFDRVFPQTHHR